MPIDWNLPGRIVFPGAVWDIRSSPALHLSFDDGPHPEITPWVLEQLAGCGDAKGSFFCIGNNAQKHPGLLQSMQQSGHLIGNHSMSHLNAWKNSREVWKEDAQKGRECLENILGRAVPHFRPPYGKLPLFYEKLLPGDSRIIMWSGISYDFDASISVEASYRHLIKQLRPGAILVFHDSEKAFPKLKLLLPRLLKHLKEQQIPIAAIPS